MEKLAKILPIMITPTLSSAVVFYKWTFVIILRGALAFSPSPNCFVLDVKHVFRAVRCVATVCIGAVCGSN